MYLKGIQCIWCCCCYCCYYYCCYYYCCYYCCCCCLLFTHNCDFLKAIEDLEAVIEELREKREGIKKEMDDQVITT